MLLSPLSASNVIFRSSKLCSLVTRPLSSSSNGIDLTKTQTAVDIPHPYHLHNLDGGPRETGIVLTRNEALHYYQKMLMVRRLETAAGVMYGEKKVRGFCHESVGQEASPVGIACTLEQGDAVINGYRLHGWVWLMGASPAEILGELTGRINGNVHGKGGSMHMYTKNFFGGHGIVGAQIPLGVGLAFAKKYKKQQFMSVTLYGDGASNQGQFFEAANLAALWKLPVLFVCENNGFGMGTPVHRASADSHMFNRCNYLPGILVDGTPILLMIGAESQTGMDVLAVREAARWARHRIVHEDKGPLVMELNTYRFVGHSVSDPGTAYRTHEEVMQMRKSRDPITHFRELILSRELAEEDEIKKIDHEVREEVARAVELAHTEGELSPEGMYTDIYANTPPIRIRGITPGDSVLQKYTNSEEMMRAIAK